MIDIALSLKYGGILLVTLYGGSNPSCGLKRRRRLKKVNNDGRRTPINGNSSHDPSS